MSEVTYSLLTSFVFSAYKHAHQVTCPTSKNPSLIPVSCCSRCHISLPQQHFLKKKLGPGHYLLSLISYSWFSSLSSGQMSILILMTLAAVFSQVKNLLSLETLFLPLFAGHQSLLIFLLFVWQLLSLLLRLVFCMLQENIQLSNCEKP